MIQISLEASTSIPKPRGSVQTRQTRKQFCFNKKYERDDRKENRHPEHQSTMPVTWGGQ
jgi:hypothetical protein